jgi:hypothetical protein
MASNSPTNHREDSGRHAILVLCFIERQDASVAVDVNDLVHGLVRDCGIVHGEREIVPASFAEETGDRAHVAAGVSRR